MKREQDTGSGPKKMVIHEVIVDHPIPSKRVLAPLRSVTVHPTFIGIGKNGYLDYEAFKSLAHDLCPSAGKLYVQIISL